VPAIENDDCAKRFERIARSCFGCEDLIAWIGCWRCSALLTSTSSVTSLDWTMVFTHEEPAYGPHFASPDALTFLRHFNCELRVGEARIAVDRTEPTV
jgi:hypothetical protein